MQVTMAFTRSLDEARGGSGAALGEILGSCQGYMYAVASRQLPRKLLRRVSPSSLVQETYLRACRHFGQFRGRSERQLLAWLRQILLRSLINLLRQPTYRVEEYELPEELSATTAAPARCAADREWLRALELALGRLPPHYRLAIELRHFSRLTFEEIGETLGCSMEAARKIWGRAHAKLGVELREFR